MQAPISSLKTQKQKKKKKGEGYDVGHARGILVLRVLEQRNPGEMVKIQSSFKHTLELGVVELYVALLLGRVFVEKPENPLEVLKMRIEHHGASGTPSDC